jgi:predicted amidohydrolase YtcJ
MDYPEIILLGFSVRTLDPDRPHATAVAARDGVITAVGSDNDVRRLCGPRTEVVEGHGAALVPGLVDAHQHGFTAPALARGADLTAAHTLEQVRETLRRERDRAGDDGWVLGWGLEYNVFLGTDFTNEAIEEAVGRQPCLLITMDGHTGLATRAALDLAGIDGPAEFADGSRVVCREGVPTGELDEDSAIALVQTVVPPLTPPESRAIVLGVLRRCSALGITAIHQMDGEPLTFELARDLEDSGELDVRLVIPVWQKPEDGPDETEAHLATRDLRGRLWRGGVVKFFADGVIDTGTSWLLEPDTKGGSTTPFWPDPQHYAAAVIRFTEAGFQCVTHSTGDAGVCCAIDAYRGARRSPFGPHRIEHIETLGDADLPRFAAEGVVASMQPLHMQWRLDDASDWWAQLLGPARTAHGWRCRDLLASGAVVPLGSDWPVATFDPRAGMAWARLRREPGTDRPPFEPEQRLTGLQALEGYTTMAARAVGEEHHAGRIRDGFRADVTAFAEDPVEIGADDLVALPVTLTVVEGRVVFRA